MKKLAAAIALSAGCAAPLGAHPHVFVETTLHFSQNAAGEIVEVDVTWSYDDFFSLLILEDMGLDPDGDGKLTEKEYQELWAFDLKNWFEGFEGDLYLNRADGSKVALGAPKATKIGMVDGRIIAGHRRSVEPVSPVGLEIQQYDPTFYVAYEVAGGVTFDRGCKAKITEADLQSATAQRDKALAEALAEEGTDIFELVELGVHYADRITLTCNGLS